CARARSCAETGGQGSAAFAPSHRRLRDRRRQNAKSPRERNRYGIRPYLRSDSVSRAAHALGRKHRDHHDAAGGRRIERREAVTPPLPWTATVEDYQRQAEALFEALEAGDESAAWRFKWEHLPFREKSILDVRNAPLDVTDAQEVVAREYGFENWASLTAFAQTVASD